MVRRRTCVIFECEVLSRLSNSYPIRTLALRVSLFDMVLNVSLTQFLRTQVTGCRLIHSGS
jgi:hypothetical protein